MRSDISNTKNINLNMIDIRYAMSNNFKIKDLPKKDDGSLSYGMKSIAIANIVLGILLSNLRKAQKRRKDKHKVFWNKNKFIMLNADESSIKYKTIAKRIGCSEELVKKIVYRLIELKLVEHLRFKNDNEKCTNTWFFKLIADKFTSIFKSFKLINTDTDYTFIPHNEEKYKKFIIEKMWEESAQTLKTKRNEANLKMEWIKQETGIDWQDMSMEQKNIWIEKADLHFNK